MCNSKKMVVEPDKLVDFIDGKIRPDKPEERVRQAVEKSLVQELEYSKSDIAVEYSLKMGSHRVRTDLAIWPQGEEHTQENIRIIIECKKKPTLQRDDPTEGVDQAKSYAAACANCEFVEWTNGEDRVVYHVYADAEGKRRFEEINEIPFRNGTADDTFLTFEQLIPATSESLLFAFKRCHNYIAGNQGIQKAEAFLELLKIIFCKIMDERDSPEPTFYCTGTEFKNSRGQKACRNRINELFDRVKEKYPTIFKPTESIGLRPDVLSYIVMQLQNFSLLESDVDVKGKAYEEIVGGNLRGDRGEFFTPRNICNMMVSMVNPTENDVICDPAMGTGGFLITAMNHVLRGLKTDINNSSRSDTAKKEAIESRRRAFLNSHLAGMDFNPVLVRATKMNMVMNNDGEGRLFRADSLSPVAEWDAELRKALRIKINDDGTFEGGVTAIVTNPPFGASIPIKSSTILKQYDLAHRWVYDEESDTYTMTETLEERPPEILFVERCVQLLKPKEGVAAMVLPNGILGNPSLGFLRYWLMRHVRILASVHLHPDTFQPNVSVQTSVLMFRKLSSEERARIDLGIVPNYDVFMSMCEHVGHDKRGVTTYKRNTDGYIITEEKASSVTGLINASGRVQEHITTEKVVDDDTQHIAEAFLEWRKSNND